MPLDHVGQLIRECARFGDILRFADPAAPVPTCPDWSADDLLWHVAGSAFAFWTAVVRLRDIDAVEALPDPDRPPGHDELIALWERSRDDMIDALRTIEDAEPMWTWSADHTAGFVKRRMAHEMLIHRVDAELTVGDRTDVPEEFATDGVDEVLRHFFGNRPEWATWDRGAPDGPVAHIVASDTGATWTVRLGALSGTDPRGRRYSAEPALELGGEDDSADVTVRGSAADLDLWLWHRPTVGDIESEGDPTAFDRLAAMVAAGI